MYKELQALYLALQESFRSSELIRKRQKKLITSLQHEPKRVTYSPKATTSEVLSPFRQSHVSFETEISRNPSIATTGDRLMRPRRTRIVQSPGSSGYASTATRRQLIHRRRAAGGGIAVVSTKPKRRTPAQRRQRKESKRAAFERLTSSTQASRARVSSQVDQSRQSHRMHVPQPFL